jgi:transcriptional regulator with XRE-family HTH domain
MSSRAYRPIDQQQLGRRLRQARERDGISLRQLAKRLGLSPSAVSQIETGLSQPSLRTLYALAGELSLSLDELLDHQPPVSPGAPASAMLRKSGRAILELDTGVRWERLTTGPDPLLDFLEVTYPPGSQLNAYERLSRSGGIEMGVILSGELDVTVGSDSYRLAPGDSVSLAWDEPHRFANNGSEPVSCVWVILPDGFDQRSLTRLGSSPEARSGDTPSQDEAQAERSRSRSRATTIPG